MADIDKLNKSDIELLTERSLRLQGYDYEQKDVKIIVDSFLDNMMKALTDVDKVSINKFGSFSKKRMPSRKFKEVSSGKTIMTKSRLLPSFFAGKNFKSIIDNSDNKNKKTQ